jgi:type I restriction enzyme S subunit
LDNKLKDDDKLSLPIKIARPYLLNDGDILFARSGATVGKTFYFDGKYGQAAFAGYMIRATMNKNMVLPEYVYYITLGNSYQDWLNLVYSQATIQNIGANKYENFPIVCPSIEEQKQILCFLNGKCTKIDSIITEMEQQIEVLKQYKTSLIAETVTKGLDKTVPMKDSGIDWLGKISVHWKVKRLKYCLAMPLQYGANEAGDEYNEKDPRYIRITDITLDNKLKEDDKLSLPIKIARPYLLNDGDVLFARSGATVGKTFYFDGKYGRAAFAGYMIRAAINRDIFLPEYVYYITLGNSYQNWLNLVYSQATIQNIGANKYENFPVVCPSIEEQKQILYFLNRKCTKIDNIITEKRQSIETMKAYKKSLIYEYVTGKKRVKGYS